MAAPRNDIPNIPIGTDPVLRQSLSRMREELQMLIGTRGNDPAVRLSGAGGLGGGGGGGTTVVVGGGGGGGGVYVPDLTPPPMPESVAAQAGISYVFVNWAGIGYAQGHGHKQTLIYGVQKDPTDPTMPTFGDAQLVATAADSQTMYALPSDPNRRWHLWLKFETVDGVLSVDPAGGINGVQATTGQDVRHLIDMLTIAAEDPAYPYTRFTLRGDLINVADGTGAYSPVFNIVTTPFTQNGVLVPAGVYLSDGYIANGTITNAMIGNAMIDDAKIASLSAARFTGGEMRIGSFLQSTNYTSGPAGNGFRINANGTAELQAAYIRGLLTASQINTNGLSIRDTAGNIILNAGAVPMIAPGLQVDDGSGTTIADLVAGGAPPPSVDLTASGDAFITPSDSSTPAPTSQTLTATIQNVSSPVYQWVVDGVVQAGAVASTFSLPAFAAPGAKMVRVNVTSSTSGLLVFDVKTIYSVKHGDSAYWAQLENQNQTIPCNYLGTVLSGLPITTKMSVARGATPLTSGVTYSVVAGSNVGFTSPTIDAAGNISIAGITATSASVKFRAQPTGGPAQDCVFTASKSLGGAPGSPGSTGGNGPRGSLTGYSASVSPAIYSTAPWNGSTDDANARTIIWRMMGNSGSPPDNLHLQIGDTVTLSNASSTASASKFWSGTAWLTPGVVISGNLLVGGTISGAINLNIGGYGRIEGGQSYSLVAPDFGGPITRSAAFISNTSFGQDFGVVGYSSQSSVGAGVYGYNASLTVGVGVYARGPTGLYASASLNPSGLAIDAVGRVNISATSGAALTASTSSGNAAIATTADGTSDALRATAPAGSGNGQIRLRTSTSGSGYGVLLRNDGSEFNLLFTNFGDANGSWTADRPFSINYVTGITRVDKLHIGNAAVSADSGGTTASFVAGKPGGASSNQWMAITINGATKYIPVWS